jgi:hypothetical protein
MLGLAVRAVACECHRWRSITCSCLRVPSLPAVEMIDAMARFAPPPRMMMIPAASHTEIAGSTSLNFLADSALGGAEGGL